MCIFFYNTHKYVKYYKFKHMKEFYTALFSEDRYCNQKSKHF